MKAKPLTIDKWINCDSNFEFDISSSKIKIIHAFQMLCPGCVYVGIPQTITLYNKFKSSNVSVVGLHSVFENHHTMTPEALEVFIKEWKLPFPIGIDKHVNKHWMPETMKSYHLQGTPSLIIIDHLAEIKLHHFGHLDQEYLEQFIIQLIEKQKVA
ncbi:MAG: TlpA family protein disulfide reductase [Oligoflexia bacterium]|nr:TlpA family protein disulfide reductase [Oligoflexia bacterium]